MAAFETRRHDWRDAVGRIFAHAPFIDLLGATLEDLAPGRAESGLLLRPEHMQHDGVVHAGVQATLADHTAGCAAATLVGADDQVLTADFSIKLLRPGRGEALACRAAVLKPGRLLTIVESEVFAVGAGSETLIAKAMVTIAVAPRRE